MAGRRLDVRLFLEGVQVPFLGATINITTNQASTASINVFSSNEIYKIRPKTHVNLFFYDDAGDGAWRTLWEGEVIGIGYAKSPNSRSAQLQCKDMSNYWDYTLRHMIDSKSGVAIRNEKRYFYGNDKSFIVPMTGESSGNFITRKLGNSQNLPESIKQLLQKITDQLHVYSTVNENYKLNSQLVVEHDSEITKLLQANTLQALIMNLESRHTGFVPMRDILMSFCRLIFYNMVSVPSASYINGNLNSFIMKPNAYGTLPPACNVVLPDLCTSVTYHRNFMAEPTRLLMHAEALPVSFKKTEFFQPSYTVPHEIYDRLKDVPESLRLKGEYGSKEGLTKEQQADLKDHLDSVMSDEEKEKGILPSEISMSYPEFYSASAGKGNDIRNSVLKVAEYRFQMARYANRTLSVVTDLNPWLVCNFPSAVFDSGRSYIGVIANISHTIDASGGGHTSFNCNLAYELDQNSDDSPTFPDWLNKSYQPKHVDATYERLFGKNAYGFSALEGKSASSIETKSPTAGGAASEMPNSNGLEPNISKHALSLFNPERDDKGNYKPSEYRAAVESGSGYAFADAYRRRPIATIADIAKFYGYAKAENIRPGELDTKYTTPNDHFRTSRSDVIDAYMNEIRDSRVFDGR